MSFLDYIEKLDKLEEIKKWALSKNGASRPDKYELIERILTLRKGYEISIIEEGDYPRGP